MSGYVWLFELISSYLKISEFMSGYVVLGLVIPVYTGYARLGEVRPGKE